MRIEIPKIVQKIHLAEYAEEFGDQCIEVWVNPPRDVLVQHDDLVQLVVKCREESEAARKSLLPKEEIDRLRKEIQNAHQKINDWYSKIWSQGDTSISAQEVEDLLGTAHESDPAFENWLVSRTLGMITDHRDGQKNA